MLIDTPRCLMVCRFVGAERQSHGQTGTRCQTKITRPPPIVSSPSASIFNMGATMSRIALWLLGVPTKQEKINARRRINQRRRAMQRASALKNSLEAATIPKEPPLTKPNPDKLPTGVAFRKAVQDTRADAVRRTLRTTLIPHSESPRPPSGTQGSLPGESNCRSQGTRISTRYCSRPDLCGQCADTDEMLPTDTINAQNREIGRLQNLEEDLAWISQIELRHQARAAAFNSVFNSGDDPEDDDFVFLTS